MLRLFQATLFLLLLSVCSASQASIAADKAVTDPVSQSEHQYKSAKNYYYSLERNSAIGKDRLNWLAGVRNFRRIYLADTRSALAPSCLYMMGRMYRRMYQQFKLPIDIDEAVGYFNDVASIFPRNSLADDALFTIADIELADKGNPVRAAKFYQKIIKRYPDGDKSSQAVNMLKDLALNHNVELPEELTGQLGTAKLVNVLPVQYWSSDDYTRIVIRTSAPVQYTTRLLEKNNDQPRRIYIDFSQSYTPPKYRSPVPIQDGLLKQVRTGQFDNSTVRVVLDIESISDYKIFNLKDPFRVVVDVRGAKKKVKAAVAANIGEPVDKAPAEKSKPPRIEPEKKKTAAAEIFITLEDNKKVSPETAKANKAMAEGSGLSLAQQLGLGVRRIVIDPGHGGKDPGAMAFDLKEKNIVLNVAQRTAAILEEQYNYEVILTRERDTSLPLEERTAIANTKNADLFVSIHVNAHPQKSAKGVETFYLNLATNAEAMRVAARENATSTHNISELQDILSDLMQNAKIIESSHLAEFVQASLVTGLQEQKYSIRNLGVKQAPFYVLIGAEMPAVLAEISFITNPDEAQLLKDSSYLQTIAEQIASGVAAYVDQRRSAALQL